MTTRPDSLFAMSVWIGGGLIFTLAGAVILRIACRVNKLDPPRYGRACFVSLLSAIAYFAMAFLVGLIFSFWLGRIISESAPTDDIRALQEQLGLFHFYTAIAQGAVVVCWAFASGALYKLFLPVPTFGRAMLVWLTSFLIWLGIAIFVAAFVAAAMHYTA